MLSAEHRPARVAPTLAAATGGGVAAALLELVVTGAGAPQAVPVGAVIVATLVAGLVAALVVAVARRLNRPRRWLSAMHVAVAAAIVPAVAVRLPSRRAEQERAAPREASASSTAAPDVASEAEVPTTQVDR